MPYKVAHPLRRRPSPPSLVDRVSGTDIAVKDSNSSIEPLINDEYMAKDYSRVSSLHSDRCNILLLIGLYILQGIPLGIASSVPYLLQSRKVSYSDQAVFSFVSWPFSLKLLWAPIVDSVYLNVLGRRKSWLIPTQYLIGTFMFILSGHISRLMGDEPAPGETTGHFDVNTLTAIFFMLNFLAATQDIAVDGWALSMLSKKNVGWVSTCNTVGQTVGFFLGNVVFLALESADFCNKYLRNEPETTGLITLPGFFRFWAFVFVIATTLVLIFKSERARSARPSPVRFSEYDIHTNISSEGSLTNSHTSSASVSENGLMSDEEDCSEPDEGVVNAYRQLWKIIRLPAVMSLIAILLTMKIGFAAADAVTGLKLMEEGVAKEHLAMMAVPMIPIDIILPVIITKYMSSERPLDVLLLSMPFRLLLGLLFAVIVWWAPSTKLSNGVYPPYFYAVMLIATAFHQVAIYSMFVPSMAFFAKVSDPAIGGTYMTLLNTVSNLGGNWPATVVLTLVDRLTWTGCLDKKSGGTCSYSDVDCRKPSLKCTMIDGYYILSVVCCVIGFLWLWVVGPRLRRLQDRPQRSWRCGR